MHCINNININCTGKIYIREVQVADLVLVYLYRLSKMKAPNFPHHSPSTQFTRKDLKIKPTKIIGSNGNPISCIPATLQIFRPDLQTNESIYLLLLHQNNFFEIFLKNVIITVIQLSVKITNNFTNQQKNPKEFRG